MGTGKNFHLYKNAILASMPKKHNFQSNHFLVIQLTPLGDACTLIPECLKLLSQKFSLSIICRSSLVELWRKFLPDSTLIGIDDSTWIQNFPDDFTGTHEASFATSMKPFAAMISAQSRSNRRYGMIEENRYYKGSRFCYHKVYSAGKNEHVSSRFQGLFELHLNRTIPWDQPVQYPFEPTEDQGYVLLHPGGKWNPRRWPVESFGKLANILVKAGKRVRILIHSSEEDLLSAFQSCFTTDGISLAKTESIEDLINEVQYCRSFVGNDSGPAHMANLFEKSTFVLWGPGNYDRIRPIGDRVHIFIKPIECRPCRQYVQQEQCERGENICLKKISVEEVADAVIADLSL